MYKIIETYMLHRGVRMWIIRFSTENVKTVHWVVENEYI